MYVVALLFSLGSKSRLFSADKLLFLLANLILEGLPSDLL